ncbi:MAG: hypothetical protein PHX80_04165 [Candidatus Nanoarchaeia archaeon]|nr:hypothetical protein [Candidatus Nanoarchaeia archaeon]
MIDGEIVFKYGDHTYKAWLVDSSLDNSDPYIYKLYIQKKSDNTWSEDISHMLDGNFDLDDEMTELAKKAYYEEYGAPVEDTGAIV